MASYNKINWEAGEVTKEGYVLIDGQQYQTVQPEYSGNTPINPENLNHMDNGIKELYDNMFYNSGDTYTISGQVYVGGALTGSSKTVLFTIFLPQKLENINSISASGLNMAVRLTSGGYWVNGDVSDSSISIVTFSDNYVTISVDGTASGTTNTPCNVYVRRLTLTFN